jgi:hypothetical protein
VISVMLIPLQSLSLVFQINSSIKFMQLLFVIILWGSIITLHSMPQMVTGKKKIIEKTTFTSLSSFLQCLS